MATLWDELPSDVREWGVADELKPLLEQFSSFEQGSVTEDGRTWTTFRTTVGAAHAWKPLDLTTGRFVDRSADVSTALEFPRSGVVVTLWTQDSPPGNAIRVDIDSPRVDLKAGFLRAAVLDAESGALRADPDSDVVRFLLPSIRVRFSHDESSGLAVDLASSTIASAGDDEVFDLVAMEPSYALVGPGEEFGFGFRSAVLDLSGEAAPAGVPADARASAGPWQGLWLPEARIFVSVTDAEDLRVHGGVKDLWVGFGEHSGLTGTFELEVVDVGVDPEIGVRAYGPTGGLLSTAVGADLEAPDGSTLVVDGTKGMPPYDVRLTVGGADPVTADRVRLEVPDTGDVDVVVSVTDAHDRQSVRTVSVRRPSVPADPPIAASKRVTVTADGDIPATVVAQEGDSVTIAVAPRAGASVTWAGDGLDPDGESVTFDLAADGPKTITMTRTWSGPDTITAFFRFDEPEAFTGVDALATYAPGNTSDRPASSRTALDGSLLVEGVLPVGAPAGTAWQVHGYASYEKKDDPETEQHNLDLSRRRGQVLEHLLVQTAGQTVPDPIVAHGQASAKGGLAPEGFVGATAPDHGSSEWWRAVAVRTATPPDDVVTYTVTRPPAAGQPGSAPTDPTPSTPEKPGCFRRLGARCELRRGDVVRLELFGEFDAQTALEDRIAAAETLGQLPPRNPGDGIWSFVVRLRLGAGTSGWLVEAEVQADESDTDGLLQFVSVNGDNTALNLIGALAVSAPLLAEAVPDSPTAGSLVPVGALGGLAALAGTLAFEVTKLTVRGAELRFGRGPLTEGSDEVGGRVGVLFDVETAFGLDLGIVQVADGQSLTARYRAIGIEAGWGDGGDESGEVEFVPLPIWDPSEGYTIDIPKGSLTGAPPLDDLLKVVGGRISRTNPTYLEVDVSFAVDTGVLTVDSARVRARLDGGEPPQLTGLGATIDLPGVLRGSGELSLRDGDDGFEITGTLDVSLAVGIRGMATVTVRRADGTTGALVGLELTFPSPIPLAATGLGVYGFLGGVAVNHDRVEDTTAKVPALKWFSEQLGRTGKVFDPAGWELDAGSHAFAAGILLGTTEGGFILHLKGMVVAELPGPRILFVLKASLIRALPELDTQGEAALLAVLDVDFAAGSVTVGIVAEFEQEKFISIRAAITGSFPKPREQWFVDIGDYDDPVTVEVLGLIRGTGYLMIHGAGIPGHPAFATAPGLVAGGLTIAVGFHTAIKIGGGSLYLEAEMGWAALVTFDPFGLVGTIHARGELRLFVVSIGATARLDAVIGKRLVGDELQSFTWVRGEVCGKVSMWLFSVSGCVSLELGSGPAAELNAPDLVAGLTFVSRPEVPIEGMATGAGIDSVIATATRDGQPVTVPIDAIPVLELTAPPWLGIATFTGFDDPTGPSGQTSDGWITRGRLRLRYELASVVLTGDLDVVDDPDDPDDGGVPSVFWAPEDDSSQGPSIALFSSQPTAVTEAVPYGTALVDDVVSRWGTVCDPVQTPKPFLWTFAGEPVGPSPVGWRPDGVPTDGRSLPSAVELPVTESWRSGAADIDRLHGTASAEVLRDSVPCGFDTELVTSVDAWQHAAGPQATGAVAGTQFDLPLTSVFFDADLALADQYAEWSDARAEDVPVDGCVGSLLRSPSFDHEEPAAGRGPSLAEIVQGGWDAAGFEPSELEAGLRFDVAHAGLSSLDIIALVPAGHELQREEFPEFWVRCLAGDSTVFGGPVGPAHDVTSQNPLPGEWLADPAAAAQLHGAGALAWRQTEKDPLLFHRLVRISVDTADCDHVEIGWARRGPDLDGQAPPYFVLGAAGVPASARDRYEFELDVATRRQEVLEALFGGAPSGRPLLKPDNTYSLQVTYDWAVEGPDPNDPAKTGDANGQETVTFAFRTPELEAEPGPPADLGPSVLYSSPAHDEDDVLYAEPIEVALVSGLPARIFAAYDEELVGRVLAASGAHPGGPDGTDLPLGDGVPLGFSYEGSWQRAVSKLVDELACVPKSGLSTDHRRHEFPVELEPHTEYLLDVVARHTGTGAERRVWRLGFVTGRYASVAELAAVLDTIRPRDLHVEDPSPLAALPDRPTGSEFDQAFAAAGLDLLAAGRDADVTVLWRDDGSGTTAPVAAVVNAPARLWRERSVPRLVQHDDANGSESYQRVPVPWLELDEAPVTSIVDRIIRHPSDARAVVLLSGSGRLALDLVRTELVPEPPPPGTRTRAVDRLLDVPAWERA